MKTVLDVRLELKDFEGNLIWEYEEAFEIAVKDDEPREMKGKKYEIKIPFKLEGRLGQASSGKEPPLRSRSKQDGKRRGNESGGVQPVNLGTFVGKSVIFKL